MTKLTQIMKKLKRTMPILQLMMTMTTTMTMTITMTMMMNLTRRKVLFRSSRVLQPK